VVVQADLQDGRKSKRLNPNRAGEGGDSASRDGQEDALAGLAHRFPANGRLNLLPQTGRHGSPANGGLQDGSRTTVISEIPNRVAFIPAIRYSIVSNAQTQAKPPGETARATSCTSFSLLDG